MSAKTTPKGLKEVTYNDAVARSKEYFGGDELAATVWVTSLSPFGVVFADIPYIIVIFFGLRSGAGKTHLYKGLLFF